MNRGNRWYRWALWGLIIGVGLYAERRDLVGLHLGYRDTVEKVARSEARLAGLKQEEAALEQRVDYLKSDPLELEAAIRKEKKLVREGETIYRILLPDEQAE